MSDIIEKFHKSVIQHGKDNNRVYLMKLDQNKVQETIEYIDRLCKKHKYTKVFAKVPVTFLNEFKLSGYNQEAIVPQFYKGEIDGVFLGKYPLKSSQRSNLNDKDIINHVLTVSKEKAKVKLISIKSDYKFQILDKADVEQITSLYKEVFKTYPFPIFSPEYILKTMEENICYFGIKKDDRLISISSAEMDEENLNAEMTDFATSPDFRGNDFSLFLLQKMEDYTRIIGFKTAYTIARSVSYGMNIAFAKNNYFFGGTLINNTNISGNIESMNVWYKSLF